MSYDPVKLGLRRYTERDGTVHYPFESNWLLLNRQGPDKPKQEHDEGTPVPEPPSEE